MLVIWKWCHHIVTKSWPSGLSLAVMAARQRRHCYVSAASFFLTSSEITYADVWIKHNSIQRQDRDVVMLKEILLFLLRNPSKSWSQNTVANQIVLSSFFQDDTAKFFSACLMQLNRSKDGFCITSDLYYKRNKCVFSSLENKMGTLFYHITMNSI